MQTALVDRLDVRACAAGVAVLFVLGVLWVLVSFVTLLGLGISTLFASALGLLTVAVVGGGTTGVIAGSIHRALPNGLVMLIVGFGGGYLVSVGIMLVTYAGSHAYPEKPSLREILPELLVGPFVLGGPAVFGLLLLLGAVGGGALGGWLKRA